MRDAVTVQKVNAGEQNAQQPEEDTSEQGRYEVENAANVSPDKVKKAVEQINRYAAAPRVEALRQGTQLHKIIIQFCGWEVIRMEEI